MEPYYLDDFGTLYNGDSREIIKSLPDQSANCVVTSPPYFGLRDYGTAKWEGGDINCDHQYAKGGRNPKTAMKQLTNNGTLFSQYEHICKKCGAIRIDNQIGLEQTPDEYVNSMVELFREIKRVLKDDGTVWLNIGDSYAGSGKGPTGHNGIGNQEKRQGFDSPKITIPEGLKPKDLIGIPWMLAFALRADGWYLRNDIIWAKPNPMPESVTDRLTKSHEHIFLLSKNKNYYFDNMAIAEKRVTRENRADSVVRDRVLDYNSKQKALGRPRGGKLVQPSDLRNKRDVWFITPKAFKGAHFATFPKDLIEPCILAGCPEGGIVLDPFFGAGTTGLVAEELNRKWVGLELNKNYCGMAIERILKERGNQT